MLSGVTPDRTAIPVGGKAAMQVGMLRLGEAIRKRMSHCAQHDHRS
jgi:hypothetical protein